MGFFRNLIEFCECKKVYGWLYPNCEIRDWHHMYEHGGPVPNCDSEDEEDDDDSQSNDGASLHHHRHPHHFAV